MFQIFFEKVRITGDINEMFRFVPDAETNEFLGFKVSDNYYCLNVMHVQGIIYIPAISKIPNVPNYVEGAINLRGKIIRVINLAKWFKFPWRSFDSNSRIIIIDLGDIVFGILVDAIDEVFTLLKSDKHEKPNLLENQDEIAYLKNILIQGERLFLEIDPKLVRE